MANHDQLYTSLPKIDGESIFQKLFAIDSASHRSEDFQAKSGRRWGFVGVFVGVFVAVLVDGFVPVYVAVFVEPLCCRCVDATNCDQLYMGPLHMDRASVFGRVFEVISDSCRNEVLQCSQAFKNLGVFKG